MLTRAGQESSEIAATVAAFLAADRECDARVEVVDVPNGGDGFDAQEPTAASRAAVRRAMRAVLTRLEA